MAASRGRRAGASRNARIADRLEEMKATRAGVRRSDQVEVEDEGDVFTTVTEAEYKKMVQERRAADDFVVDDEGLGYYDDGEEHLFDAVGGGPARRKGDRGALSREELIRQRELDAAKKGGVRKVSSMFLKAGAGGDTVIKLGSHVDGADDAGADDDLESMLAGLDGTEVAAPLRSKRAAPAVRAAPRGSERDRRRRKRVKHEGTRLVDIALFNANAVADAEAVPDAEAAVAAEEEAAAAAAANDDDGAGDMDVDDDVAADAAADAEPEESAKSRLFARRRSKVGKNRVTSAGLVVPGAAAPAAAASAAAPQSSAAATAPSAVTAKAAASAEDGFWSAEATAPGAADSGAVAMSAGLADVLETDAKGDPALRMWWIDVHEERYARPGVVYVFGKVLVPPAAGAAADAAPQYRSCCAVVSGFQHRVFVLPREGCTQLEVYTELSQIMRRMGVAKFGVRKVTKKYAFEIAGIPEETDYMELVYSATEAPLSEEMTKRGETFSHVFGAQTSCSERFLLQLQLMGPSWLTLSKPTERRSNISHCAFEVDVDLQQIAKLKESRETPTLVVASLSLKTVVDPKTHKHEIVVCTVLCRTSVAVDRRKGKEDRSITHFTAVRTPTGVRAPLDLRRSISSDPRIRGKMVVHANERSLLNFVAVKLHKMDPDVLLGHNILGFGLDVLLHRMQANKVPSWSKIGRLRRTRFPKMRQMGMGGPPASATAGRLVCDTYSGAKELIRQTSYSLTALAAQQLRFQRKNIEPLDVPGYFNTSAEVISLAKHTETDAFLTIRLMKHLELLPLTKQLTELAGNRWARSLRGARAERIEYLLLHEFDRLDYIVPDKVQPKNGEGGKRRGKAAYAGGLVLEPKKGLYDSFILMLDFNSLYPSIIQEYNLCFTTVERKKKGHFSVSGGNKAAALEEEAKVTELDDMEDDGAAGDAAAVEDGRIEIPPVPAASCAPGILPRVIKVLIDRRGEVKKMIKTCTDPERKKMLDVRQKALKIMANSMYGCLGFKHSRFFAQPIAALVTQQGRAMLQNCVEISNGLGYEVVYGDTDSIMINTRITSEGLIEEVYKIGRELKREVNKLYKVNHIEIDAIYRMMLLLKKKKYAALLFERDSSGTVSYQKEMKGLDLVRRDWCVLSKEVGANVLDLLLQPRNVDEAVDAIHSHLASIAEKMRAGSLPLAKYVITKGISKALHEYKQSKGQPHLKVATRMISEGKIVNAGDHIPYVICKGAPGVAMADCARHPDEVKRSEGKLVVDIEWYLSSQMVPPIARLCDPIDGTSSGAIAEAMGLDATRFRRQFGGQAAANEDEDDWAFAGGKQVADSEKFKAAKPLVVACPKCNERSVFSGLLAWHPAVDGEDDATADGAKTAKATASAVAAIGSDMVCPNAACKFCFDDSVKDVASCFSKSRLVNTLRIDMRSYLEEYYAGWTVCDDAACGLRTQQQSVRGTRCLVPGCRGRLKAEYPAKTLHTQLTYYKALFDIARAHEKEAEEARHAARIAATQPVESAPATPSAAPSAQAVVIPHSSTVTAKIFDELHSQVDAMLHRSSYHWVDANLWKSAFGVAK